MIRFIGGIILSLGLALVVFVFLIPAQRWYFENQLNVIPPTGVRQDMWLDDFSGNGLYHIFTALIFTIAWHTIGFFYYRINDWTKAGGRLVWLTLLVLMLLSIAVIGWQTTLYTEDWGRDLALLAYLLNAIIIFYASSVFASPTTVKFAPPGAISVGRIWS